MYILKICRDQRVMQREMLYTCFYTLKAIKVTDWAIELKNLNINEADGERALTMFPLIMRNANDDARLIRIACGRDSFC